MEVKRFSSDDIDFISKSEYILRKNELVKQLFKNLSFLRECLETDLKQNPIHNFKIPAGKISKGENFHGLPYLVLDFPSIFKKENIFAFRTIVWWGNFYSNNLILKGKYLSHFKGKILVDYTKIKNELFYVGKNPWQHEIDQSYVKISNLDHENLKEQITQNKFVKICRRHEIKDLNKLKSNTLDFYQTLRINLLD